MSPHHILQTIGGTTGAIIFAALLSTGHLLDGPSDAQARIDTARAAHDAQQAAQQTARFERAARRACGGDNGAFVLLADNAIQCMTHRGHKTFTAKVAL